MGTMDLHVGHSATRPCEDAMDEPVPVLRAYSRFFPSIRIDRDGSELARLPGRGAVRPAAVRGQRDGFGFASQGTWICPTRSRHSAGIGAPDSSRRYQSWTWSTLTSRPDIVTLRALRTVAAASAATWFSKIAAYGVWDIHQRTR